MKLLLVGPAEPTTRQKGKQVHHLGLACVAALATPYFDQIEIVEEQFDTLDVDQTADLVGITIMTCHAPRAYHLADHFRRRGIPTICGGPHASFTIDESLQHFDAVVVDEAEPVWFDVMLDFAAGRLKRVYRGAASVDLSALPTPRKDLFNGLGTLGAQVVQTSRGCPLGCDYCTVTRMYGRKHRTRPVEHVVEEIKRFPGRAYFFVDDNIFLSRPYAYELFEALVPLRIKWGSQASLEHICRDEKLLKLAARAGCMSLFIGVESLDQQALDEVGKPFNKVHRYEEHFATVRRAGINVLAAFMFGFEHDTPETFDRVYAFALRNRLSSVTAGILTPFPGTDLYARMSREGLIVDRDWSHYSGEHLVWRHPTMGRDELETRYDAMVRRFYAYRSITTRFWANRAHPLYYLGTNCASHWRVYHQQA